MRIRDFQWRIRRFIEVKKLERAAEKDLISSRLGSGKGFAAFNVWVALKMLHAETKEEFQAARNLSLADYRLELERIDKQILKRYPYFRYVPGQD